MISSQFIFVLCNILAVQSLIKRHVTANKIIPNVNKRNLTSCIPKITFYPPSEKYNEKWDSGEIPWDIKINITKIEEIVGMMMLNENPDIYMLPLILI